MRFLYADYWPLLFLVPIFIGVLFMGYVQRRRRLAIFVNKAMWERIIPNLSFNRRFWRNVLLVLGLFFLILTVLRPQWGKRLEKFSRKGQDILIAIDTSKSMLAQDVKPSRLKQAQYEVLGLVDNLKGDRVGLIVFSGLSFVQCPLTLDYPAVKLFLSDIQSGMISKPGTDIAAAINLATATFKKRKKKDRVLILMSDGESFDGDAVKAAKAAAKQGVKIYTVAIGTKGGEPIPLRDDNGQVTGYKKDKNGEIVLSKLNDTVLRQIAQLTKGKFFMSENGGLVMEALYKDLSSEERKDMEERVRESYIDRYQLFLFLAFLLFLANLAITERQKEALEWKGRL